MLCQNPFLIRKRDTTANFALCLLVRWQFKGRTQRFRDVANSGMVKTTSIRTVLDMFVKMNVPDKHCGSPLRLRQPQQQAIRISVVKIMSRTNNEGRRYLHDSLNSKRYGSVLPLSRMPLLPKFCSILSAHDACAHHLTC